MHRGRLPDQLGRDEMSVLIKGMEMPKDCVYCKWHTRWGCGIT